MEDGNMAISEAPSGITSLLDTDLYKLTMQCAVLKFFPTVEAEYSFTNRTPQMRLSREAYEWLRDQVSKLGHLAFSQAELEYLRTTCSFLHAEYLEYLKTFRLHPETQIEMSLDPPSDTNEKSTDDSAGYGDLKIHVQGLWLETILYEIPLLALTSEAYFKFVDRDWNYDGQEESAYEKGLALFEAGCAVSEFGSRRRRDLKTHDTVVRALARASQQPGLSGKLLGTSNVYLAMRNKVPPNGTVAHEWYMGIASITNDYVNANELGLEYWLKCYGEGVLGIALTDTFGTPAFFKAFKKPIPQKSSKSYAEAFNGVRQDSGDPKEYVKRAADFYKSVGITEKTLVFSDSLNVDRCVEYKAIAEEHGFKPSFGVGTFFTNDFSKASDTSQKSKPLNIVIKISKAEGRPSIKISDNAGKNTGDQDLVEEVKARLGYSENVWTGVSEAARW